MRILDLDIPFLEIEGVSQRQEWYANCLREAYVTLNYERFSEIDERMNRECDKRILAENEFKVYPESFQDDYTNAEKACLFSCDAAGIIAALKEAMRR